VQRLSVYEGRTGQFSGPDGLSRCPWTVIAADIMGPLPRSKSSFAYILVIQDLFTKCVECRALRAANGKKIQETLEDLVLSHWDTLKFLLTDNGMEFVNQTQRGFAQEYGITHTTIPPYHPQANPMEQVNRILKTMIVAFLDCDCDWDVHLGDFRFAYNTAQHSSIGTTPTFLNLDRELEPTHLLHRRTREVTEVEPGRPVGKWSERMRALQLLHRWVAKNLE